MSCLVFASVPRPTGPAAITVTTIAAGFKSLTFAGAGGKGLGKPDSQTPPAKRVA